MRTLVTSPTLVVLAMLLVWLVWTARTGRTHAQSTWDLAWQFVCRRAILAYLIAGACANMCVSALSGYINPRDYLQDVIAARQFLQHSNMYPDNLPQLGVAELSVPIRGRGALQRLPLVRGELKTMTDSPAPANAHPPLLGIMLAAPVHLFGSRGSFVFIFLLSIALLCLTVAAILRELFPAPDRLVLCVVMALVFGWFPVGASLREGQPAIILFALMTAGWLMLRRNRPWMAGASIGLAAGLHAFPALLMLYFAIRNRRALVSAIGTIALLVGLTASLTVKGTFQEWLNTTGMISRHFVPRIDNLSIAGLISSFSMGMGWGEHVKFLVPAMVLLIAGALVVFLEPWNRREVRLERLDVEYALFAGATLLASPIVWARYLPIMVLPLAVLVRNWRLRRPPWAVSALLPTLILMSFSTSVLLRAFYWLSGNVGFVAGWLAITAPSYSVMAILLLLGSSAQWTDSVCEGRSEPVVTAAGHEPRTANSSA